MDGFTGYPIELENREALEAMSPPGVFHALSDDDLPKRVDFRNVLKIENQGSMGSCQGHALSTCVEGCYYIASGGQTQHLSRLFGYLGSQKLDGINGDSGSTLHGGARLSTEFGICLESVLPYPSPVRYPRGGHSSIPAEAWANAKSFRVRSTKFITQEPEVRQWLGSGAGLVEIGIAWGGAMSPDNRGAIMSFRAGGGGHAVALTGYLPCEEVQIETPEGYVYILDNSWGNWGEGGRAYVAPRAIRQMLDHRFTVFLGLSDMLDVKPRSVDFSRVNVIA